MEQTQHTQQQTGELYIAQSDVQNLPSVVRNGLKELGAQKQEEFIEEYHRKAKNISTGYILGVIGFHYVYLNKWGLQILYWFTMGGFGLWWLIDLFRIPTLIENYNKDVAMNTFRLFR